MVGADRQQIIETNRSLRNIKNELENLLEKGVIADDVFESIHALLPAESPLSGAAASSRMTPSTTGSTQASSLRTDVASPVPSVTSAVASLDLRGTSPAPPPSYNQTGPPPLPGRTPEPAAPPSRPVLAHARALYRYAASDARDVSFERDDRVAVLEYMNDDWWMGRNLRTGQEGIFPKAYVLVEQDTSKTAAGPGAYQAYPGPAAAANHMPPPQDPRMFPGQQQQGYQGGPPPQQNPYDANVPPMAVAEQPSKGQEMGKKFGKKLGNAAIFGAGATIGSNIVNSIF